MNTTERPQRIVDSHVHFLDTGQFRYPWLDAAPALRRTWSPDEYARDCGALPVTDVVFVEAAAELRSSEDEVAWVERISGRPRVAAIVARASLTDERGRRAALQTLRSRPLVRGVRDDIQGQPRGYCCHPSYVEGARIASELGLLVELCVVHPQLPDVVRLVQECPETRFVLDHCGKPGIRSRQLDPWRRDVEALASFGNVVCKISGLLTEAEEGCGPEALAAYVEHVFRCFGADRVLFGSDWPVMTLAGASFTRWCELLFGLTRHLSEPERSGFFWSNAASTYGFDARRGSRAHSTGARPV
jgi:L-fuconolactonase